MPRLSEDIKELDITDAQSVIDNLSSNPVEYGLASPRAYGVPHDEWRTNQVKALQILSDRMHSGDRKISFLELPTGSGKSAIPTAFGEDNEVLVFVESHALLEQYERVYGFKIVKGMASYDCVHPDKVANYKERFGRKPLVSECHLSTMSDCPFYDKCPYIIARDTALASRRMACTYAFGMLSLKVRLRHGIGVWDEAHLASQILLDLSTTKLTSDFTNDFSTAPLPLMGKNGLMGNRERKELTNWITATEKVLENPPHNLFLDEESEWTAAKERIKRLSAMVKSGTEYYFSGDPRGHKKLYRIGKQLREKLVPLLEIKPLTAAGITPKMTGCRFSQVLMSATIGDPAPLASELGFKKFYFDTYPHPIPVDKRRVWDLGFERMTYNNLQTRPILYQLQATRIAAWIQSMPEAWRGIILTASYAKLAKLVNGLQNTPIGPRLFPYDANKGVTERLKSFYENNDPGKIATDVSYAWGHGVSFDWDKARFIAIASVPFGDFTDPFEKVRHAHVPGAEDFAWWRAYTAVVQMCGRVSRGEVHDNGKFLYNGALLADGSATTFYAKKYYPRWFAEAIQKWDGQQIGD